jgi:hypothetical protein
VIIGMVLAMFQQWCGINVIFNYAQEIFASAGFDINSTLKSIVATGSSTWSLPSRRCRWWIKSAAVN